LLRDTVKILDWGEDGYATEAETVALRASFKQEVAVWHKLDHPNVTKACISFIFLFLCFLYIQTLNCFHTLSVSSMAVKHGSWGIWNKMGRG
jgi:hypothetical protein